MGLYEFYARKYDPVTGIWLTQDTYRGLRKTPASLHHYQYTLDSPTNYIDLDGRVAVPVILGVMALGGTLSTGARYVGDVVDNYLDGGRGVDMFKPRSSSGEYAASFIGGMIPVPGVSGAVESWLEDAWSSAPVCGVKIVRDGIYDLALVQVGDEVIDVLFPKKVRGRIADSLWVTKEGALSKRGQRELTEMTLQEGIGVMADVVTEITGRTITETDVVEYLFGNPCKLSEQHYGGSLQCIDNGENSSSYQSIQSTCNPAYQSCLPPACNPMYQSCMLSTSEL